MVCSSCQDAGCGLCIILCSSSWSLLCKDCRQPQQEQRHQLTADYLDHVQVGPELLHARMRHVTSFESAESAINIRRSIYIYMYIYMYIYIYIP